MTTEGHARPLLLRRPQPATEPALLKRQTPNRAPLILRRPDVVTLATAFLLLQFLIPARLVLGGLGSAGRPAVAVALVCGVLWVSGFFQRGNLPGLQQPIRWVVSIYCLVQLASFAAGMDRGLPPVEARSAYRWLIITFALSGLALAVAEGVAGRRRLNVLLDRLIDLTTVMAVVGILQATVAVDLTQYIRVPGLRLNAELIGVGSRGDVELARVAGTANHYIEFGVVLAVVLPLALHRAMHLPRGGQRQWRWVTVALIAMGIPLSLSRSGIVALAAAGVVLVAVWPWSLRVKALIAGLIGVVVFRLLQPGVLGTLRSLFSRAEDDPSVQNRLADYAYVTHEFPERPWLGRGVGTLLPDLYILLDNQYLNTLLSAGAVGLAAFLSLFCVPIVMSRSLRLRGATAEDRHLGQALAAALFAAMVSAATFDSLSFATYTGVLFLLVGIVGAAWRIDEGPLTRRELQSNRGEGTVASPWMVRRPGLKGLYERTDAVPRQRDLVRPDA